MTMLGVGNRECQEEELSPAMEDARLELVDDGVEEELGIYFGWSCGWKAATFGGRGTRNAGK
jgi:hypothetical protein